MEGTKDQSHFHGCRHSKFIQHHYRIRIDEDTREETSHPTPVEELVEIEIDGLERVVKIGVVLPLEQSKTLIELLRSFKEMFTLILSDLQGITTSVITHDMNIDPLANPFLKKKKGPRAIRRN